MERMMIQIKNELIGTEKIQAINARDLWKELEVKTRYDVWIKRRILETQAIENQDFISLLKNDQREIGATVKKEYIVSLDMAKHFCMLERNEKGRQIRQYFIDVEKEARRIEQDKHPLVRYAEETLEIAKKYAMLESEQKKLAILQKQNRENIEELQAKTQSVLDKTGYYSILAWANMNGIKLTRENAARLGKIAKSLSDKENVPVGKVPDERWGTVNTYHNDILRQLKCYFKDDYFSN